MRLAQLIPLLALAAFLILCWKAWRGADDVDFTIAVDLTKAEFPPLPSAPNESASGLVVDEQGGPVRDALLVLIADGRLHWTPSAIDGRFVLAGLPVGEHLVYLVAPGLVPCTATLNVPTSEALLAFQEHPATAPTIAPPAASNLSGQVDGVWPAGAGAPYRIALMPYEEGEFAQRNFPRWQTLAADGGFLVPNLQHGRYRVLLLPPQAGESFAPDLLCSCDALDPILVDHPAQPSTELRLLNQAGVIRGRILRQEGGRRSSNKCWPVAGAHIRATPIQAAAASFFPGAVTSAVDGSFALGDLPPGLYQVRVTVGEVSREQSVRVAAASETELEMEPFD